MYFEFHGVASGMEGQLNFSLKMFVGPFSSEGEREEFLEKCHKAVNEKSQNPNQIKFILCDQLPVKKADPNILELSADGDMVPARPKQWGAIAPEKFLESIKESE